MTPVKIAKTLFARHSRPLAYAAGLVSAGTLTTLPLVAQAQETRLPLNPNLTFQTSGPGVCINIGDWYTSQSQVFNPCRSQTNPPTTLLNQPAPNNAGAGRVHQFFISVTQADLDSVGGSVVVSVDEAASFNSGGTDNDEVRGDDGAGGFLAVPDPTRFRLFNTATGEELPSTNFPNGIISDPAATPNAIVNFTPITQPGTYRLDSVTGAFLIPGDGRTDLNLNDDDNGFEIVVGGRADFLIGQLQGSFQVPIGLPQVPRLDFYLLVGPGTNSLFLRNFDFDVPTFSTTIQYTSPQGALATPNTPSGSSVWNGAAGTLDVGGDTPTFPGPIAGAGLWQLSLLNLDAENQIILEANSGNQRLPIIEPIPIRAGNFTITPDTTLTTQIGVPVDHRFTVTNNFFTTDIVNLALTGTDPNYTVQLLDGAGNPLPDTDGDGIPDTGIIDPDATRSFILRATPNNGATGPDTTVINATSFMDREVRRRSLELGGNVTSPAAVQRVTKITSFGGDVGGLSIFKGITRVFRTATGTVETYGNPLSPPNIAGFVGTITPTPELLQAGDLVEYAIYYQNSSTAQITNVEICDPIPPRTSFVPDPTGATAAFQDLYSGNRGISFGTPAALPLGNGLALSNIFDGDQGEVITPLSPRASCPNENAGNNGAVVVRVGTVEPGEAGFVKFVTRVN